MTGLYFADKSKRQTTNRPGLIQGNESQQPPAQDDSTANIRHQIINPERYNSFPKLLRTRYSLHVYIHKSIKFEPRILTEMLTTT